MISRGCLITVCLMLAAQQPPMLGQVVQSGFSISGVVVDRASNKPLDHVRVMIAPVNRRDRGVGVLTSSNGQFAFSDLPAGKYTLQAARNGASQYFREYEGYSTAIAVGAGLDSSHIVFPFDPPRNISGTVLDEEGDPVLGAQVYLIRQGIVSGRSQTTVWNNAGTTASGSFRFHGVPPGTYFLAASGRPWYAQYLTRAEQNTGTAELDAAYPLTYFSDALDFSGASPIKLSGRSVTDLRITLRAVPAVHVRMTGLGSKPAEIFQPVILAQGPGNLSIPIAVQSVGDSSGITELTGLAPGRYLFDFRNMNVNGTGGRTRTLGSRVIELNGDAMLEMPDSPGNRISGKIAFTGGSQFDGLGVALVNLETTWPAAAAIAHDGTFNMEDLAPGSYEIRLTGASDFYVKSATVRGATYSNGILNITDGATVQISIAVGRGVSQLSGIAIQDGKPFPGAMVLLVPENLDLGGYIPRDQSDSDGTFTLNLVPPGRYTIVAIDDGRDFEYRNHAVIKPYLAQSQVVDVPVNAGSSVQVPVVHRQQ